MMEKVDLQSGEVAAFHSKTEVNLESTDSNDCFENEKNCFRVRSKISKTRK